MRTIVEQTNSNPVLAAEAIREVNDSLRNVAWLDQVFGRAWRITRELRGKKYTEPCLYVGGTSGNEYETLVPSSDLGCYSFWLQNDPDTMGNGADYMLADYSLVVWCDLCRCFGDGSRRDTDNLKKDILSVLVESGRADGVITVKRVYEDAKNVFKGFTFDETANQYLMHPYWGMKIDVELRIDTPCWD